MEPYSRPDGGVEPTAGRLHGVTVDRAGERSPRGMMHRWIVRTSPTPSFQLERRTKGKEGSGEVLHRKKLYYPTKSTISVIQSSCISTGSFLSLYLDKRSRTRWVLPCVALSTGSRPLCPDGPARFQLKRRGEGSPAPAEWFHRASSRYPFFPRRSVGRHGPPWVPVVPWPSLPFRRPPVTSSRGPSPRPRPTVLDGPTPLGGPIASGSVRAMTCV